MDPVEAFLAEHANEYFRCPFLGGTVKPLIRYVECVERHRRRKTIRSFGRKLEIFATPQDAVCRRCKLGRLHAKELPEKQRALARDRLLKARLHEQGLPLVVLPVVEAPAPRSSPR